MNNMKMKKREICPVGSQFSLLTPGGGELSIYEVDMELLWIDEKLRDLFLSFQISHPEYLQISQKNYFNLKLEVRGLTFAGGFQPTPDIEIESRLRRDLLGRFEGRVQNFGDAVDLLRACPLEDELRSTESYYAMYVKQPRGPVKTGFQTLWAEKPV